MLEQPVKVKISSPSTIITKKGNIVFIVRGGVGGQNFPIKREGFIK